MYLTCMFQVHDLKVPVWSHFCWKLQPSSSGFRSCCSVKYTFTQPHKVDEDTSLSDIANCFILEFKKEAGIKKIGRNINIWVVDFPALSEAVDIRIVCSTKECHDSEITLLKTVAPADFRNERWHWACFRHGPPSSSGAYWLMSDCLPVNSLLTLFSGLDFFKQITTYRPTSMWELLRQ